MMVRPAELIKDGQVDALRLARLITRVENSRAFAEDFLSEHFDPDSPTFVLGITGPPGAGKSSLTDNLIKSFRKEGKTVAVVAVDPSSPFTGGAILGDRIRMQRHFTDEGVYIRSMGTRGHLGGLSSSSFDVINLLKTVGFDVVLVETVGVGQSEVDVMNVADTILLVLVPGLGDDIQALKAGIMEIADIFVINKADKEGKERLRAELKMIVELNRERFEWVPPIVETVAIEGKGTDALLNHVESHRKFVAERGSRVRKRARMVFEMMLRDKGSDIIFDFLEKKGNLSNYLREAEAGSLNFYRALKEIEKSLNLQWRG